MSKRQVPPVLSQLKKYCGIGFKIFPAQYVNNKKMPFKGFDWLNLATDEFEQIKEWYNSPRYKDCMWAIVTGPASGVVVIDLDVTKGKDGRIELKNRIGGIPKTVMVRTPSGGMHLYFRQPGGIDIPNSQGKTGLDIRGTNGYVILPPSCIQGRFYKWEVPYSDKNLQDLPREFYPRRKEKKKLSVGIDDSIEHMKSKALVAMSNLLPSRSEERDEWLKVLMCLHSIDPDDSALKAAAHDFSRWSSKYSFRDVETRWSSFRRSEDANSLTLGSLIMWANEDAIRLEEMQFQAEGYLIHISRKRFEDPASRLEIAKALTFLGNVGGKIWLRHCRDVPGLSIMECKRVWSSLRYEEGGMDSLKAWAKEDEPISGAITMCPVPRHPLTPHFKATFDDLDYEFKMNEMDNSIYWNGMRMEDPHHAKLFMELQKYRFWVSADYLFKAITDLAMDNKFHPLRDYLTSIKWDGEDHISKLASYIKDEHSQFPVLLRKWLIGAVIKAVLVPGERNPMLVLDGKQSIGKSRFTEWLCGSIPDFWNTARASNPDRDERLKLCRYFILEASELNGLAGKTDKEAWKDFLSLRIVSDRLIHARHPLNKPTTASFIGTMNNINGYLYDPSGESRFRTCTITSIDWRGYTENVDVDQVWAQAYALAKAGETSELDDAQQERVDSVNVYYKMEDAAENFLSTYFDITHDPADTLSSMVIVRIIRDNGGFIHAGDNAALQRIAGILKAQGIEKKLVVNKATNIREMSWIGLKIREGVVTMFDQMTAAETLFNAKVKK